MNITLLGFGKMGRMVNSLAGKDDRVVSIIDPAAPEAAYRTITKEALADTDVVIDFSHPSAVVDNVRTAASFGRNMVVGTTGWYKDLDEVRGIVVQSGIGFIYSSNFSIGVQLFLKMVRHAGQLFNDFPQYDVFAHEFHHNQKADSPSGTALSVAQALIQTIVRKTETLADTSHGKILPHQLHLTSTRGGFVPGTHEVFFDSETDTIEIRHQARSRCAFALGALAASEWIRSKRGFFTIDDYLADTSTSNS